MTPAIIDVALTAFVTMFVIIDPIGLLPIFISLTKGTTVSHQRKMAIKGVLIGGATLLFFALLGDRFLSLLGVGLPSFRIAGGAMLFLMAIEMVFDKRSKRRENSAEHMREEIIAEKHFDDISVFPLSVPLISGPGAIASIMLLMSANRDNLVHQGTILGVLAVVLLIVFILFMLAPRLEKLMGVTFTQIVSRVLGVILGALAIQYIVDGIKLSFLV
ncbi:MarC family protein [Sneathiella glossodoripedis]|uniref:MarC family protein n=1 Tax=Sneathiella glossodoripedis TaxID=418853 RepID=UPI0006865B43|nr:MarC family protein [Sneathiella glossodoripedis]